MICVSRAVAAANAANRSNDLKSDLSYLVTGDWQLNS
jgi:hypothetical protein